MEFYTWQNYRCAFEKVPAQSRAQSRAQTEAETEQALPALLLIHPIGVGLSKQFWRPFIERWEASTASSRLYNLDLLGCGESDMPSRAYRPEDWAKQLAYFIEQVAQEPVILVVQGALLPVAVRLMALPAAKKVRGLVLSGPPAWRLMTRPSAGWKQKIGWGLLSSPLGNLFYRYARRQKFLRSFSERQLFDRAEDVTDGWLKMLDEGAADMASRYAVFSFLAGFWRQDYAGAIARIQQPVLVVMGEDASSIDRQTAKETEKAEAHPGQKRLQDYIDHFPRAEGVMIKGRNVLPYESAAEFVTAIAPFVSGLST